MLDENDTTTTTTPGTDSPPASAAAQPADAPADHRPSHRLVTGRPGGRRPPPR